MRRKEYLLHIYINGKYIEPLIFGSRTGLTTYLRSNGGIFASESLDNINDRLITINTYSPKKFEVEELFTLNDCMDR